MNQLTLPFPLTLCVLKLSIDFREEGPRLLDTNMFVWELYDTKSVYHRVFHGPNFNVFVSSSISVMVQEVRIVASSNFVPVLPCQKSNPNLKANEFILLVNKHTFLH